MMKKLLALALVCVLCVGLLPAGAQAMMQESDFGKWIGGTDPNCQHTNTSEPYGNPPDEGDHPGTHLKVVECSDCGAQFITRESCTDGNKDNKCDKCNKAMPVQQTDLADATVNVNTIFPDNTEYQTGTDAITPSVSVYDKNGNFMYEGSDYTVEYANNTNVGTGKIILTGVPGGRLTGTRLVTFNIKKFNGNLAASQNTVYLFGGNEDGTFTYTGSQIKPPVMVELDDNGTLWDSCYSVKYGPNIGPGQGSVTITGTGETAYGVQITGTRTVYFKIADDPNACKHPSFTYVSAGMQGHYKECTACKERISEIESHDMEEGQVTIITGYFTRIDKCRVCPFTEAIQMNKAPDLETAELTGVEADKEYTQAKAKQIGLKDLTEGVDYTKTVTVQQNGDGSKSWVIVMDPVENKAIGSRTVTVKAACEHPSFTYVRAGMQGHYKECTVCKEKISEIESHDMEEGQVTIITGYFTRIDKCRVCPFTEAIQMNKAPDLETAELTGVEADKEYTQAKAKQIGLKDLTEGVDYTKTVTVQQNGDGTKSWVIVMDPVENKAVGSRTVTVKAACEHPSFTYVRAGMQGHYKECTVCKEKISEIESHDMEEGQVTIITGYFTRIDKCRVCPFTEAIQMNKAPDLETAELTGVEADKEYTQAKAKQIGLKDLTEGVDYTKTLSVQQNGDETESWVIKFQSVENKSVGERTVTVKKVKACEHKHTKLVNLGARGHYKLCLDCGREWAEQPHQLTTQYRTVEGARQEWEVCDVCPYRTLVVGGRKINLLEAVAEGIDENAEYMEEDLSQIGLEDLTEGEDYTKSYVSVENGDGAESWVVRLQPIEGKSTGEWVVTLKKKACPHENRVWSTNEQFHWERCLDCDHLTAPEAHVFEPKVVTPATCTQNAVLRMECKCGMVDPNGRTAPAEGDPAEWFAHHVWGAYSYDSRTHWQVCTVCSVRSEEQKHTVTNVKADREPTCLKDGFVSFDCPVCQAHIEAIADEYQIAQYPELQQYGALGHDFSGPLKVCTGPNVCTSESQGTHAASCVRCGTTDLEHRSAHAWMGLHNVQNGTCNDPNDPVIQEASCECGAALHIEKIREHVPVEDKSQDVQATCTESGKINGHRCVICGTFYDYEFVEALGHDWVEDEKVEATCLADGFIKSHCARCNEEKTEILKMKSPDGKHHFVPQYSKQPTCTEKGTANGEKCKYCDAEQAGETGYGEIPALGHKKKAEATKKGRVKEYITSNGVIEVTCYEVMFLCERCSHALGVEYYTVGTNPKISKYLIEPGKDVKITDLGNGIHIDGNMANDGGAYFNGEVKKAFNEVLDLAAEKYTYKKVPANSFIIEFTDEFLAEQEDGDYTLEIINGSEYWPLVVTIKDHKFTDVQPMDVPQDVPEWSMADYEAWVNQIRDAGAQLKELTVGCPEREK